MTAIVGILNKHAVAVAADSALTVGNDQNHKIYNTSQKIFQLSKKQPVGIMTYNNANFMGTPWDVIIKLYYDKSGDKDLPTVEAYRDDFLSFLKNKKYFTREEDQKEALYDEMLEVVDRVYKTAKEECYDREQHNLDELSMEKQVQYCNQFIQELSVGCEKDGVCEGFERYTFEQFKEYAAPLYKRLQKTLVENDYPAVEGMWEKVIFEFLRSKRMWDYTGLVFIGYGADQIYPALTPMLIDIAIDGHLRMCTNKESDVEICNDEPADIKSYGQDDVVRMLLCGVANDVRDKYQEIISSNLVELKGKSKALKEDEFLQKVSDSIDEYIGTEYINGLYRSIAAFNVPDLASMAESLISVTNLQRHITSSEESVGGPVDVAVITRSEGFVWVKHKNWFTKE